MIADTSLVAELRPSANCNERRGGCRPTVLLLHYTGMGTGEQAVSWLCDPQSEVSSHYVVHEDGSIVQLVPEDRRAWHAGEGAWRGRCDVNSDSIGIEIVNGGHGVGLPPYPDIQIESVIALCRDIVARNAIQPEFVLAHSDIAPDRKEDPGENFPWARLHAEGVGHFVEPAALRGGRFFSRGDRGEPVSAFQAMLSAYGYSVAINGHFTEETRLATMAFQRHFRPERVDGVADISTIETLHRLLGALERSPFDERTEAV